MEKPGETLAEWAVRATPAEIERANWRAVAHCMRKMRDELQKDGCRRSWIDPYLAIAESCGKESLAASPAQETAFQKALDISIAQGWNLKGNVCPVLYTDEINGQQVCRDDLWIATTEALKPRANSTPGRLESLRHPLRWPTLQKLTPKTCVRFIS